MRVWSIVCFVLGGLLAVGGLLNASKPSVSPLLAVIGSFAFPAIFIWWGVILHKKANAKNRER
jgi:membrane protease YdiL (CAAX protease family)